MAQPELFDTGRTRARRGDPETSHEAAAAISDKLRLIQERVMKLFRHHGPMTQHRLITKYKTQYGPAPDSTIRTRCAELVDKGLLRDSGTKHKVGRRNAIVWELVN